MKVADNWVEFMEEIAKPYRQLDGVKVYIVDEPCMKESAVVRFRKGEPPQIYMKGYIHIAEFPEILAHEMAHVIAGNPVDQSEWHNHEWADAFAKLLKEMHQWMKAHEEATRGCVSSLA